MADYLKRAKQFELASSVMALLWMGCVVVVVVEFVRGFFHHSQWLYMIGWMVAGKICNSASVDYRATSQQYMRDGVEAGELVINEQNRAVPAPKDT